MNDRLTGSGGSDILLGGAGRDTLRGGAGADLLTGGPGRDILISDGGADILRGGAGADEFRFVPRGIDSGVVTIEDFTSEDIINLRPLDAKLGIANTGDQAFVFIREASFSGKSGELRYAVSGANVIIDADQNGDGASDLTIILTKVTAIDSGDFIF